MRRPARYPDAIINRAPPRGRGTPGPRSRLFPRRTCTCTPRRESGLSHRRARTVAVFVCDSRRALSGGGKPGVTGRAHLICIRFPRSGQLPRSFQPSGLIDARSLFPFEIKLSHLRSVGRGKKTRLMRVNRRRCDQRPPGCEAAVWLDRFRARRLLRYLLRHIFASEFFSSYAKIAPRLQPVYFSSFFFHALRHVDRTKLVAIILRPSNRRRIDPSPRR